MINLVPVLLLALYLSTFGVQCVSARSVSLLFENDGDWENLDNRTSALLFSDPETLDDAFQVGQGFDETLQHIWNKLSYLKYQGVFNEYTKFWVASESNDGGSVLAPFTSVSRH
ncbi:hypothetical protein F5050DRAFT_1809322 [Lentinula boryana]|uniref:Uncharacterized protein n=1 Tax=Lentinula boryana TaxID=40481 RepID=A0ABQ8Q8F4_9AGAR|nr:hypothetical protein F5050DRAFT_1809322 [Lentinula boryana]